MVKQSIFGRIAQLAKANINALLDAAEDPQKMLDQMVRDYTNNIAEAEAAVAQTIGNLRMLEQDHAEDVRDAAEWGSKAQTQVNDALKAFDVMDPTSEVSRFEEKVRREEARVIGQQELAASSLDAQFNDLEELGRQTELEARLAALKNKGNGGAIDA